ncbi:unnamed protein product [Brassica rapa subsp. trilocularis]
MECVCGIFKRFLTREEAYLQGVRAGGNTNNQIIYQPHPQSGLLLRRVPDHGSSL